MRNKADIYIGPLYSGVVLGYVVYVGLTDSWLTAISRVVGSFLILWGLAAREKYRGS